MTRRGGARFDALLLLLLASSVPAPVLGQVDVSAAPALAFAIDGTPVLDVPFVPQSAALCGGAAVAMVLRYWGERGVYAEEFAPLVVETGEGKGIRTDDLAGAVRRRGWHGVPFAGDVDVVQRHLAHGRPVITLIEDRPGRYHYVVLVAWRADTVVLHDPARGPLRRLTGTRFARAWQPAGRWALLVLPDSVGAAAKSLRPHDTSASAAAAVGDSAAEPHAAFEPEATDRCSSLLDSAVVSARRGELGTAERALLAARDRCADRAAITIELSALRFRQRRYTDAAQLAEAAVASAPERTDGWDLLASSRYLLDDHAGALRAWNRIGRPHNDLTRIDGVRTTRFDIVSEAVGIPAGALVSSAALARARRRVDALPTVLRSRVDYRPVHGGDAEVQAAIVERPLLPLSIADLLAHGVRALADSRVHVDVANALRAGEAWLIDWVWQRNRRAVELGLAAPDAFGAGGVWQVHVADRVFSYRLPAESPPTGEPAPVHRETHRAATVSLGDWVTSAVRWQVSGSIDDWSDRGGFAGLLAELQLRSLRNRLALRVARGEWWSLGPPDAFQTVHVQAAVRSSSTAATVEWSAHSGVALASDDAPRSRWSGAGNDFGAHALLRAHRLVDGEGITDSAIFGPRLLQGGVEVRRWLPQLGPLQLGVAAFADAASVRPLANHVLARTALDVGAGVRLRAPGVPGAIRADAALGITDGATALSLGWAPAWPHW